MLRMVHQQFRHICEETGKKKWKRKGLYSNSAACGSIACILIDYLLAAPLWYAAANIPPTCLEMMYMFFVAISLPVPRVDFLTRQLMSCVSYANSSCNVLDCMNMSTMSHMTSCRCDVCSLSQLDAHVTLQGAARRTGGRAHTTYGSRIAERYFPTAARSEPLSNQLLHGEPLASDGRPLLRFGDMEEEKGRYFRRLMIFYSRDDSLSMAMQDVNILSSSIEM